MCGRYYLEPEDGDEALLKIIEAINRKDAEAKLSGEVFPTDVVPVLAGNRVVAMRWGFSSPSKSGQVINARSETADKKPMFRDAFERARCLIPASGYYEWRRADKVKFGFTTPSRAIYMAGLWRQEMPSEPARFVILTREASPSVAQVHSRMPVLIKGDARRAWLDSAEDPSALVNKAVGEVISFKAK